MQGGRIDVAEELAVRHPDGIPAGQVLPAPDRRIDVERIELDAAADAACPFGGEQRSAAAQERVDDDVAAVRAIKQRVHHQLDRFDRRVQLQHVVTFPRQGAGTVVLPHVGAVAPVLAELDIVGVPRGTGLEDTDQFMLGAIE
jgi:hypothetical protein